MWILGKCIRAPLGWSCLVDRDEDRLFFGYFISFCTGLVGMLSEGFPLPFNYSNIDIVEHPYIS